MTNGQTSRDELQAKVIEILKSVYDPEISTNIYDLGLVYKIDINEKGRVDLLMTLTSPACPAAGVIPQEVKERLEEIEGVSEVSVALTFDPPWDWSKLSEEAKLTLNLF